MSALMDMAQRPVVDSTRDSAFVHEVESRVRDLERENARLRDLAAAASTTAEASPIAERRDVDNSAWLELVRSLELEKQQLSERLMAISSENARLTNQLASHLDKEEDTDASQRMKSLEAEKDDLLQRVSRLAEKNVSLAQQLTSTKKDSLSEATAAARIESLEAENNELKDRISAMTEEKARTSTEHTTAHSQRAADAELEMLRRRDAESQRLSRHVGADDSSPRRIRALEEQNDDLKGSLVKVTEEHVREVNELSNKSLTMETELRGTIVRLDAENAELRANLIAASALQGRTSLENANSNLTEQLARAPTNTQTAGFQIAQSAAPHSFDRVLDAVSNALDGDRFDDDLSYRHPTVEVHAHDSISQQMSHDDDVIDAVYTRNGILQEEVLEVPQL